MARLKLEKLSSGHFNLRWVGTSGYFFIKDLVSGLTSGLIHGDNYRHLKRVLKKDGRMAKRKIMFNYECAAYFLKGMPVYDPYGRFGHIDDNYEFKMEETQ